MSRHQMSVKCLLTFTAPLLIVAAGCKKVPSSDISDHREESSDVRSFLTNGVSYLALTNHFGDPAYIEDRGGGTSYFVFLTPDARGFPSNVIGFSGYMSSNVVSKVAFSYGDVKQTHGSGNTRKERGSAPLRLASSKDEITFPQVTFFAPEPETNDNGTVVVRNLLIVLPESDRAALERFSALHVGENVTTFLGDENLSAFRFNAPISGGEMELNIKDGIPRHKIFPSAR